MVTLRMELIGLEQFFRQDSLGRTDGFRPVREPRTRRRKPRALALTITRATYIEIMKELATKPPERACVLLGPMNSDLVSDFAMDTGGESSATRHTLGHDALNRVLRKYLDARMEAKGFCHSHPLGCMQLSAGDLAYCRRLWGNPNNDGPRILMPIVVGRKMYPYVVDRSTPTAPQLAKLVLV